jgi:hypothetical protein
MNKDEDDEEQSLEVVASLRATLESLAPDTRFEIREFQSLTKDQLLEQTIKAAHDVGPAGTLFWYVTTHGWSDGFSMKEGRVHAADLEGALRTAREGMGPIKRLYMLFDYCGSGGLVGDMHLTGGAVPPPGTGLVNLATASPQDFARANSGRESFVGVVAQLADRLAPRRGVGLADGDDVPALPPPYEHAVFLAPAGRMQETEGSTLTWAMDSVLTGAPRRAPNLTIKQFLDETAAKVATVRTEDFRSDAENDYEMKPQTVVYRSLPDDEILQDFMLKPGRAN